jgi:hypothetical protein
MQDFSAILANRRRPSLLVRAARFGLPDYRRDRDLTRLIGPANGEGGPALLPALLEAESQMEAQRREGDLGYSIARHIELLAALMAEVRLSRPSAPQA